MSLEDLEQYKEANMEKNAWIVCEEIKLRVDDEKGPGGDFMRAYVTEHNEDQFFFNKDELLQFCEKAPSEKHSVPGHNYFKKITNFIDTHIEIGELYMEYRFKNCLRTSTLCDLCSESSYEMNTEMEPVPRAYPDIARLNELHYCSHKKTPKYDSDGNLRPADDLQPRARLRQLFQENKITSNDEASVNQFSLKHVVEEKLVLAYVKHFEMLKFERNKRNESRNKAKQKESMKEFSKFNWRNLFETGKL